MQIDALETHEFFQEIFNHTERRKAGGFVVISGVNSSLGSGKTSLACALYYALNNYWGTECIPEKHCHMSASTYLDAWSEAKRKTALILDEANVFGLEASRHMSKEALTLGHMVQVQRVKQIWTITTSANWAHLTKRVRELANYNLVCTENPGTVQAYKVIVSFGDGKTKRKRIGQPFKFPSTENTEAYQYLAETKDKFLAQFKDGFDDLITGKSGAKTEKEIRSIAQGEVYHKMTTKENSNLSKDEHVKMITFSKGMGVSDIKPRRDRDAYLKSISTTTKAAEPIYIP